MRVGHKVLMEVEESILLIVRNPQGILDQQLMPRSILFSNIISILINYILIDSKIVLNTEEGRDGFTRTK